MVKLFTYILFLLVVAGIYWCFYKLIETTTYEKQERFLHCRYLVAYIAYLLIFFNRYTYTYWLMGIDSIMNSPELESFWNLVLPMRRYELVYLIGVLLLSNLFLIIFSAIVFGLVKFIFRKKLFIDTRDMDMWQKIFHFPWLVTSKVYKYDEDENRYCVTAKGFTMSLWAGRIKYMFALLLVIELVVITVAIYMQGETLAKHMINLVQGWYMVPMAAFILFGQIQYYLEGNIDYEAGTYGSEDVTERLEGNMDVLMYLYSEEFKGTDALLGAYAWKNMKVYKDGLINNGLNQNQLMTCEQPEVLEMINNQLREAHISQNTAYQNAISSLLNKNSINVRDYIQGEFLFYLAAYMNFFISQEKTFLILCKDKNEAKEIKKEVARVLKELNKIYSIWKIADVDGADSNEEMSILVCSYQELVNHNLLEKRNDFFENLSAVILCNGVEFCAQGNVQKEMLFAELSKVNHDVQYILLSRIDSDSLRTSFEYYTNQELLPYKNDQLQNNMFIMLWADDSLFKIQQAQGIGSIQSPYLGVSIPLALLATKYDLPRVKIFASKDKGYQTYRDAMTMSYQEIINYLGCGLDLNKMIVFNSFSLAERADLEVLILHDSEYNFYNTLWAWMKYGGKNATMVHVVSPAYMLREYFAANLKELILRNNDFDAFISYRSGLKHTRFLALLLELSNAGVDEEELMKKSQEYEWGYDNVTELLADCLRDVLNTNEFYNIFECFHFERQVRFDVEKDRYIHRTRVKLTDENIRARIRRELEFAKLVSKNNVVENLPILKGNVYNSYLRGQIVPINGYMCRVTSVNNGMVFVEQTMPADKKEYLQTSEFVFRNMKKTDECVDMDILDFNMYSADVERKIYGYWASAQDIAFQKKGALRFYEMMDINDQPISVRHRNMQILEMKFKKSEFGSKANEAQLLLAFMLRELFKTLYPANHENLFAVTEFNCCEGYWMELFKDTENVSLENKVRSIVPFACQISANESDSEYFSIYVVEFSSLEMGMLTSLYANRMKLFRMMASYLEWYLEEAGKASEETAIGRKKKATYLNLGGEGIAPCFAAEEVLAFCNNLLPAYEKTEKSVLSRDNVQKDYVCSFCGKPSLFTYNMADGRKMCRSCKQQQINQKDELKELYLETFDFLCKGYHIKLRKNIHLRLKSADAIREKCQISGGGRVLGFYNRKNHDLWIEARGPKNALRATMIHELTHAWQFANLDIKKLETKQPNEVLLYLEGHSSYMEVDAMRKLGEDEYANYLESMLMIREDEYGQGYRMLKKFLESKEQEGSFWTPYKAMEELINNL